VDTDEIPDGGMAASAELFRGIDNNLKVLVNQMHKNNQAMSVLLKQQQKKTSDSSSDPRT